MRARLRLLQAFSMSSSSQETLLPHATSLEDSYNELINALHPKHPTTLEIDILPSTFPPQILYDHPALALPKPLLIQLYLIARQRFFTHLFSPDPETYNAALHSTAIILLFDPNHLTAANFRKTHIRILSTHHPIDLSQAKPPEPLATAIQRELYFLSTLLTSSLKKHTKSPTLWHQRLWLHETHLLHTLSCSLTIDISQRSSRATRTLVHDHWEDELGIVMKAGERHPRNYYAWQYARLLFEMVEGDLDMATRREQEPVVETLGRVKEWCLLHPRDVSGWAFLVWLMERVGGRGADGDEGETRGNWKAKHEARRIVWEVEEWVGKYGWVGGSVEWFLKATKVLGIGE